MGHAAYGKASRHELSAKKMGSREGAGIRSGSGQLLSRMTPKHRYVHLYLVQMGTKIGVPRIEV